MHIKLCFMHARLKGYDMKTDILIVGTGCAGLFAALHLPTNKNIVIITKSDSESNDSHLAQGGICVLRSDSDYNSFFEDTMRAGHYENDKAALDVMISSSQDAIADLIKWNVDFNKTPDGNLAYTREGAHSSSRILFHKDITGHEITSKLLAEVKSRENITIHEYTQLLDIIETGSDDSRFCCGAVVKTADGEICAWQADYVILATGGIGGLFEHSTNFPHLTGDGVAIALKHDIKVRDINYIQIHPTTFYSESKHERSFLISESVRGEGAHLLDKSMRRFVNELLPRDVVTKAIHAQMAKDGTAHVWEDLRPIPKDELISHFPNILAHCTEMGYDATEECIPVVPAQHYYMGGVASDLYGRTSLSRLYAIGETACTGLHGRNRLASNSLLEALVFAKRAARNISVNYTKLPDNIIDVLPETDLDKYKDTDALQAAYKELVLSAIAQADMAAEAKAAE